MTLELLCTLITLAGDADLASEVDAIISGAVSTKPVSRHSGWISREEKTRDYRKPKFYEYGRIGKKGCPCCTGATYKFKTDDLLDGWDNDDVCPIYSQLDRSSCKSFNGTCNCH